MNTIHDENVAAIARLLDVIPEWVAQVLFIGGATLGFYVENTFHNNIRVTNDIDVVLEVVSLSQHRALGERLRKAGFTEQMEHMSRWKRDDLIVDVLPLRLPEYLPPKLFLIEVFERRNRTALPDGRLVHVPSFLDFIGLKFLAHEDRGQGDWLAKDMEDIVTVIDGAREPFVLEVTMSHEMREFLISSLTKIRTNKNFQNLMPG